MCAAKVKTGVDLEHLSQSEAAWLIGKPSSWLRNRADLVPRNANDNTYNAKDLVAAIIADAGAKSQSTKIVKLNDTHLESLKQVLYSSVSDYEPSLPGLIRVLDEVIGIHGELSGLAAIGELLRGMAKAHLDRNPQCALLPSVDRIRASWSEYAEQQIDREIASIEQDRAIRDLHIVYVCPSCKSYRWGRTWVKPPYPSGYHQTELSCDNCTK